MADLQRVVVDDDTLDQQLEDGLAIREGGLGQPAADALAERRQVGQRGRGLCPLAAEARLLVPLLLGCAAAELDLLAARCQLGEGEDAGLVGVDESAILPAQAIQPRGESLRLGPLLLDPLRRQLGLVVELGQQALGLLQQGDDVPPDGDLQVGARDRAAGGDLATGAVERVLSVAL